MASAKSRKSSRRRPRTNSWILYACVVCMTCFMFYLNNKAKRAADDEYYRPVQSIMQDEERATALIPAERQFPKEHSEETARPSNDELSNKPGSFRHFPVAQPDTQHTNKECDLSWKSSFLDTKFYEQSAYDIQDVHSAGYLTRTKPAKPVYRNAAIKLDPDRFLMPVVEYGPNNQITGFREAAFIAVKLNRTLVIPKFFKHLTNRHGEAFGGPDFISPEHRMEVKEFCKYISCITLDQYQSACGNKVEAAIVLHEMGYSTIVAMESYLGMRISLKFPYSSSQINDIELVPPERINPDERYRRKFAANEIETLFHTNARCVIYPFPLYNLQVPSGFRRKLGREAELVKTQEDISKYPDSRLLLSIAYHSRNPEYITKIARDFLKFSLGNEPFLSLHWRFNKDDFMKRCDDHLSTNEIKEDLCDNALLIKPKDLAEAVRLKIDDLRRLGAPDIENIYIASPPSEREFVSRVGNILKNIRGWRTLSSVELEQYINNKHGSCEVLKEHFSDIVSTTEMEICTLGFAFLGSVRSSWSVNVEIRRKTVLDKNVMTQYDGDVLSIAKAVKHSAYHEDSQR